MEPFYKVSCIHSGAECSGEKIWWTTFFLHRAPYIKYIFYKVSLGAELRTLVYFLWLPLAYGVICMVICRGKNFDRKVLHSWKIWNFRGLGPVDSSAAVAGQYRIMAITLASRGVVGWNFAGKWTILVLQTGKIIAHNSSFTPRYGHFTVFRALLAL